MSIVAPENLFPLPLTAFERFMLADESSDYPMVFYLQVRLKGVVDRDVMKLAVDDAFSRHPLLCCRVKKHGEGVTGSGPATRFRSSAGIVTIGCSRNPGGRRLI